MTGCECGKDFLDSLRFLSFGPEADDPGDLDDGIDLTTYFPPFYGLMTEDGDQIYIVDETGSEKFYSLR